MFDDWRGRAEAPEDVVTRVPSGARCFVHGAAMTPTSLVEALCIAEPLEGVRLYHLHTGGPAPWAKPEVAGRIRAINLFTGAHFRDSVAEGHADFVPIFLSDIPFLFTSGQVPLDVAIISVSPPDRHGMCTLGTSVDAARAAVASAKVVIAEINERAPRTMGSSAVPFAQIDAFTVVNRPLHEASPVVVGPVEARIGELIADLVEDGSTLQLGIGAIPEAALARLGNKRDLGLHTEMFSDRVVDLVEGGVITNRFKEIHPGRSVTSFVNGSARLYDWVHDNLRVEFHPCDRTNDTHLIRANPKVVAVNSALELDLSGQVCADSIGSRIYSGIGGQMDFIRGAALSKGGKPIIALPSTAKGGTRSRIQPTLSPGAGVVTTRGHVHWVVTEHGAVNLHGMTLRERAEALIGIAHPDFRAELWAAARGVVRLGPP
ncbi:4-hydroxybutyrate CoA-transferase [Deltaproteobacteria bacterium]|nr:4-hydroxybutyrate CoA-transferase [Deltaproteobacteria bacterium]